MRDLERVFDSPSSANWYLDKMMVPALAKTPVEYEDAMIALRGQGLSALTMSSMWFSLYRTDFRPTIEKIVVPFLFVLPETALVSMECVEYLREHINGQFCLAKDFPGTTHAILVEEPQKVAQSIKGFIREH